MAGRIERAKKEEAAGRAPPRPVPTILELFRASLWLGLLGFGGGLSVLGMIGDLSVRRRKWLSEREFANTATI